MMRVVDISNGNDFRKACLDFRKKVDIITANDKPNVVVGIATGGKYVLEEMGYGEEVSKIIVKRQRAGTELKKKFGLSLIVGFFPGFILDFLRNMERLHRRIVFCFNNKNIDFKEVILVDGDLSNLGCGNKVLIIDDAVDSGYTIRDVKKYLSDAGAKNFIVATLSQTFPDPVETPDYVHFGKVMLRCPWSMDKK